MSNHQDFSERHDGYVDSGIREKVDLLKDGNDWYFYVSDTAIVPTVPYENRPDQLAVREAVEKTCEYITKFREREAFIQAQDEEPDHE
jgi:hypothetical protein